MNRWRKTVDIKRYLDAPGMSYREQGSAIIGALRQAGDFCPDVLREMERAVGRMKGAPGGAPFDAVRAFNRALDDIYDDANRQRIWLG